MRTLGLISCIVLLVVSCKENNMNKKEITVSGCVTDSYNKVPIPGARVTLLCWYRAGWDKTDFVSIDTIADKNGCFSGKFEAGYKVVVASVTPEHYPNLNASEELDSKKVGLNLILNRRTDATDTMYSKIDLRHYIVQNSSN